MSLQTQIKYSKDADLIKDLTNFRRAIAANEFPEMVPQWRATVELIEHEIEQRSLLASVVTSWAPSLIDHVPF